MAFGIAPLGWQDIKAYTDLIGEKISALELDILMAMDKAAVLAYNQAGELPKEAQGVSFNDTAGLKAMFQGIAAQGGTKGAKNG